MINIVASCHFSMWSYFEDANLSAVLWFRLGNIYWQGIFGMIDRAPKRLVLREECLVEEIGTFQKGQLEVGEGPHPKGEFARQYGLEY